MGLSPSSRAGDCPNFRCGYSCNNGKSFGDCSHPKAKMGLSPSSRQASDRVFEQAVVCWSLKKGGSRGPLEKEVPSGPPKQFEASARPRLPPPPFASANPAQVAGRRLRSAAPFVPQGTAAVTKARGAA